jgi:hypothetical protein
LRGDGPADRDECEPASLVTVTAAGGVAPIPRRSITRPLIVCPETTATVKSATPRVAPVSPCESTKRPPAAPPVMYHHGVVRDRSDAATRTSPRRPGDQAPIATSRIRSPDPKEITEPRYPSPRLRPSSLLTRDCVAVRMPTTIAPTTPAVTFSRRERTVAVCAGGVVMIESNASRIGRVVPRSQYYGISFAPLAQLARAPLL